MTHEPTFSFRTHGGVCAGEQWIYDRDEPIARLESSVIEQPEQNLRYFDRNLKPVNLRDLKLAPGGRPLMAGVQLFWGCQGRVLTTDFTGLQIEGQESECLKLTVITRDPGGVATSRRILTLTYDPDLGSYVYDFAAHLEIHSPEVFDVEEQVTFEYSDPWYCDIPGPGVEFPGMWRKRYSHLLAEHPDGTIWQMPLNHMATGIPAPKSFRRGGVFTPGFDPGNNPAMEFVGETADRTSIGVCNWGYDIHLAAHYSRDELYDPICEHFRVRLCPDEQVRDMMSRAEPIPPIQFQGFSELPLYERRTSFATGLRLDEPTPGATDPWPWEPRGNGAEWCRTEGRSDSFSLKIAKETPGPTEWVLDREGDGAWAEKWAPGASYRVVAHIKTRDVQGRGSFLAVRWAVYNSPERHPYICSEKLVGTNDWTRVEVEINGPPPTDISSISIILRQDGSGTTLFDDLAVDLIQD